MSDDLAQIDLGLLDRYDEPPQPVDPDPRPTAGRPAHLAVLGCFALVLATTVASQAPPPPPLTRTATLSLQPGDQVTTGRQLILVSATREPGDGAGRLLTAYDTHGRRRWRTPAGPVGAGLIGATETTTATVLYSQETGQVVTSGHARDTGQLLWSAPGFAELTSHATTAVVNEAEQGTGLTTLRSTSIPEQPAGVVWAVDVATGRTLWRASYQARVITTVDSDGDRVVVTLPDGTVEVRQARTGVVTATGRALAPATQPEGYREVILVGGVLATRDPDSRGLAALDLDTLAVRWHQQADVNQMYRCGALLCLLAVVDGAPVVQALHPTTGVVAWQRRDVAMIESDGHWLVTFRVSRSNQLAPVDLLDPSTGRRLTDLRGWQGLTGDGAGTLWFTQQLGRGHGTDVGVLRAGGREIRSLGTATGLGTECLPLGRYLACRDSQRLVVWRLRG